MSDQLDRLEAALSDRYAIDREIGSGGMATVYLAHDVKHDRKVAIKVLRPELAAVLGAERFLNEIKVTANLQHPHILPLFDSGEADRFLFYVMPFVEGETLQDRLHREKQLPVDEAVRITTEVANALDYAHRHDVIHRDIKPGNILLHDGQALVADFGIALAVTVAGGNRVTETGLSLGTPEYMSPEQATADRELDARSDVYSLGAVLYEMLVGEPPHTGPSVQAIISRVVTGSIEPVATHRPSVPVHVDAAVQVALQKLAADRFQSAQEFAGALTGEHFISAPTVQARTAPAQTFKAAWPAVRKHVAGIALGFLVVGVGLGWLLKGGGSGVDASQEVTSFTVPIPGGLMLGQQPEMALSPDGKTLVFRAQGALHVRPLAEFASEPLEGAEHGQDPFFSPDGQWIGFQQRSVLKKVRLDGGPVSELANIESWLYGADWGEDGNIVYAWVGGIHRVAAVGGEPEVVTTLDSASEHSHMWPQLLEHGRLLLFTALGPSAHWQDAKILIKDLETGERKVVVERATFGRYVPTGHVIYANASGTILAVPFDLERREVTGEAIAVESGVHVAAWGGGPQFAVSPSGVAAFIRGTTWSDNLLWSVDREGRHSQLLGPLHGFHVNVAPNGRQLALTIVRPADTDIHVLDLSSGQAERLTFDPPFDETPVWSPDGRRIAYACDWLGGVSRVYVKDADPAAQPTALFTGDSHVHLTSWSPDGQWLAFQYHGFERRRDIYAVRVDSTEHVVELSAEIADESNAQFSPDGRWVAYTSDGEVYVMPFPPTGGKWQVSLAGGSGARWSDETGELFFWKGDTLLATQVTTEGQFARTVPGVLYVLPGYDGGYDVTPDGERFFVKMQNPDARVHEIHVIRNWFEVLRERAGASQR